MKVKVCLLILFLIISRILNATIPVVSIVLSDPVISNNPIFCNIMFGEGTSNFSLQCNANNDNNYKSVSLPKTGSNIWMTATVAITNASVGKNNYILKRGNQ